MPKEEKEDDGKKVREESKRENKILMITLIVIGIIIVAGIVYFISAGREQTSFNYEGINFTVEKIGNLTFYDTATLATSAAGTPFGFRIRTNPNKLKNVPFYGSENFNFTTFNLYKFDNGTFSCKGYGAISIANLYRTITEMGMQFVNDQNATCDSQGKYNFFLLKYGNETQVKQIGYNCYELEIKGNDSECEILPATEKLMVDMYAKYINLSR